MPLYRKDANQDEIVAILEQAGLSVEDLAAVPHAIRRPDIPDILVGGYHQKWGERVNLLVEIKTDDGKLTPGQERYQGWWRGAVITARTADDVLRWFGYEVD